MDTFRACQESAFAQHLLDIQSDGKRITLHLRLAARRLLHYFRPTHHLLYIYIWNLHTKGIWQRLPWFFRIAVGLLPVAAVVGMLSDIPSFTQNFFHNTQVPLYLLVIGSLGQIIFTLRFVYQWYYSYRRHASLLPLGFWIISLIGSGTIVIYGIIRSDPVLILGQSFGFVAYARNIVLLSRQRKSDGQ